MIDNSDELVEKRSIKIWWVNQGKTFEDKEKKETLWAPVKGRTTWENISKVKKDDIILHYKKGYIHSVSKATSNPEPADDPHKNNKIYNAEKWGKKGRQVRVEPFQLEPPIPLEKINHLPSALNIEGGPLNKNQNVKNGYLFNFSKEALNNMQIAQPETKWPAFSKQSVTSSKRVENGPATSKSSRSKEFKKVSDIDKRFYNSLSKARTNYDIFRSVKYVTGNPTPPVIKAFVSCLFKSKVHRKAISRCIRKRLRKKAIPALLGTLNSLSGINKLRQLILLCKIGHKPALLQVATTITEMEDIPPAIQKRINIFLTNNCASFANELVQLVQSDSPLLVLFAAPWCVKYDPKLTCKRLHDISIESNVEEHIRNRAFGLLSRYNPACALEELALGNIDFETNTVLKTIENAYSADDYEPDESLLLKIFSKGRRDIRIVAAIFLEEEGHKEAKDLLRTWLIAKYKDIKNQVLGHSGKLMFKAALALTRSDDKKWISFFSSYEPPDNYRDHYLRIWSAAKHPIGLDMWVQKLNETTDVNKMFSPMVAALRWYGVDARPVLRLVVATGDERLKKRAEELLAHICPDKSLEEIVEENDGVLISEPDMLVKGDIFLPSRRREHVSMLLERDPKIPRTVKEIESYTCQVCGRRLFQAKNNAPYAETHHIQPLGHDGPDCLENILCLCPLCHRLFHLGVIGIDVRLGLHLTPGYSEKLLPRLHVTRGRQISEHVLRYHWITFFVAPEELDFSEDEEDD